MTLPGPVLHVSAARGWRGGEVQLVSLAERLRRAGIEQRVACVPGSPLERTLRARGLAVDPVARRLGIDPRFALAIALLARRYRAALVHAHDAHAHGAVAVAASAFGLATPVVVHRRVDFAVGLGPLSAWKYRHRSVRRFICVSDAVARVLRPAVPDRERLAVVYDGIEPGRFIPRPDLAPAVRTAFGIPADAPLVGNVAAHVDHKDHCTFLDTAARVVASGSQAHFLLVGDGPLRPALEARARELGVATRVHFTGFRDDVPAILPAMDVFLFTSKEEGLGSSILDAWACGVPVVATAAGGVPELVRDGETGLLAPIGNATELAAAVRRVLSDRALRDSLVATAAARVRAYSADHMAIATLAIYGDVAAEARVAGTATESKTRALGSFIRKSRFQR